MPQYPDGTEYLDLTKPRLKYDPVKIDKSSYPTGEVIQKLAKNRNWPVCRASMDKKNRRFVYVCAINSDETEVRTISFEEACKDFHWKSFKVINDGQSLLWSPDPSWDKEVEKIMKRTARASKQKKLEESK